MHDLWIAESFEVDKAGALIESDLFGTRRKYEAYIGQALEDLADDPYRHNTKDRSEDLGGGRWTYHIRHVRTRVDKDLRLSNDPRHTILYVPVDDPQVVRILGLYPDHMELGRHLLPD
ncbi:hypothetical protein [Azospirillum doebereinerae]